MVCVGRNALLLSVMIDCLCCLLRTGRENWGGLRGYVDGNLVMTGLDVPILDTIIPLLVGMIIAGSYTCILEIIG
jgi:hypothetical protein